ncbi:hypothetical protein [Nocardia concava]|uniref:hypothetical protein n=1 Tax=Nocardia concava TaxID=257281 RepID=UPI0002E14000|nr:hypothetical protein [Nocardia concava]
MDADFTAGPGDSRPARQPGYRLTHPDTASPGTSPNPVLTGIDTGSHGGLGRNGQDVQAVQWSSAPVTLRSAPESDALPRRLAPDLPQRTADPEAVAARLAADEPFAARITTDLDAYAAPATNGEPFAAHPATNGSPFATRTTAQEDVFGASPVIDEPVVSRRYAPDPEPAVRPEHPVRLESMEAVAASLRESVQDVPSEPVPAPAPKAPSRRRAAPEPEPVVAQQESAPVESEPTPRESKSAEFRTSDATIELHHIMRLLTASHDLDEAAKAAESGEITVAEFAQAARRTRAAAVDIVAAWYGGSDHMRKFGEVLLQAAAESSPAPPRL